MIMTRISQMTTKLLRRPATILLAALIVSSGCTHDSENGDKKDLTPAAAGRPPTSQPQPAGDEKPPAKVEADDKLSAHAEEPGLKPLLSPLPSEKDGPGATQEPPGEKGMPPSMPPKADEPLRRAPDQTNLPTKPVQPSSDLRTNPLRENRPPSGLQNPMRQGEAKLPGNIKPNGPVPGQPQVPAQSQAPEPSSKQTLPTKALPKQQLPKEPPPQQPTATLPATAGRSPAAGQGPVDKGKKDAASSFDPIKENGPIFVGWKKPGLAIVITGREDGYLEPCGCAGLDRMKGGLSRRHTMIEELRGKGWPLLCVDVGGLSKGYGVQAELKFQITVDAMKKMGYQAIGFSPNDLRLHVDSLVAVAAGNEDNPSPFVSADVGLLGFEAEITARWRVVDVGGVKVGVTSILSKDFQKGLAVDDIEFVDPQAALAAVVPEMKKHCKLMILLAYATRKESMELSKKFPQFAVVVAAVGPPTPPAEPTVIDETKALLIDAGEKGMDAVVLALYVDRDKPYRYQRVPLDSRFAASKDMKNLMKDYQQRLKTLGLAGLSIKPVTHPAHGVNGEFVGSQSCEDCHEPSYDVWKKSKHAKAWATLLHTDPPRNYDPECISCHVVGWHPTNHYPYKGGFLSEKLTPKMTDVGCESCHGPGGSHVKAEKGNDEALQLRMQKAVRVTKEEAKNHAEKACRNCHDLDNSPDFDFETDWPKVEHTESE